MAGFFSACSDDSGATADEIAAAIIAAQATATPAATAAATATASALTPDQIRQIVLDEMAKAGLPEPTSAQLQEILKSLTEALKGSTQTADQFRGAVKVWLTSNQKVQAGVVPAYNPAAFPKSAAEAAAIFGGDASRWEPTADCCGWHLREEAFTTLIQPKGFLGEGYNDTKPGKNPDCYTFVAPTSVQGATIWQEAGTYPNAVALQKKMAIPVWDDGKQHACQVLATP